MLFVNNKCINEEQKQTTKKIDDDYIWKLR